MAKPLYAPFPWMGGKRSVAKLVWSQLGDIDNYIEPFAGSAAVLLLRPHSPRIETINDADCYVANFWRATSPVGDAEAVAFYADAPVNEADLHANHRWLVLSDDAETFRRRMRTEPDYFDAKVAGRWCHGLCCWIGSGWCVEPGQAGYEPKGENKRPLIGGGNGQQGHGIHAKGQLPKLSSADGVPSTPSAELSQQIPLIGDPARGVHRGPGLSEQVPMMSAAGRGMDAATGEEKLPQKRVSVNKAHGLGMDAKAVSDNNRPQLADAFSRGRGVNGNDQAETCRQRREWLLDWFSRLRDRLRSVRVCCGDWSRVCSSPSVTTRLGTTGVFLDPPYGHGSDRQENIYAVDSMTVAADVRAWCLEWGGKPKMRIVLAGYAGEGHEELAAAGWTVQAWKGGGGYGNRTQKGKDNSAKERLWFSPGCLSSKTLFDSLQTVEESA